MTETVDLAFLGKQIEKLIAEVRTVRHELKDVRSLTLSGIDHTRRLERNMGELKDDLELMLKSELMGSQSHFESRIEQLLENRFDELKSDLASLIAEAVSKGAPGRGQD